jgi:ribosomal protein L18
MKKTYRKKKATRRKRYSRRFVKKYYKGGDKNRLPIFFTRKIIFCEVLNSPQCNEKCQLVYVGIVREGEKFEYSRQANIGDRYIRYNILSIDPRQANPERTSIITYDYKYSLWRGEVFNKDLEPMVFYMYVDDKNMWTIPIDDSDKTYAEIKDAVKRQDDMI